MSRLLGIGNNSVKDYKKLKQTASDDDIESSGEEYSVFNKNDRSTIQLQLVPSITEKRRRPNEEIHVRDTRTNWKQCLLLLGVIVVAICGLSIGILLVRKIQAPSESQKNVSATVSFSQTEPPGGAGQSTKGVTEETLSSDETVKWKKSWEDVETESCIRLMDLDGDGLDDILFGAATGKEMNLVENGMKRGRKYSNLEDFCHKIGEEYPCLGFMIALRGYDGHLLWNLTVRSEVFLMNCEDFDINKDGKPDCIGTGRQGTVVAFNPYTGTQYWSAEDDRYLNADWNTYQAVALPDWDRDGVPEALIACGGDPDKHPEDHDRDSGRLLVLSGATGQLVGHRYLEMPDSKESYMTPVLYQPQRGSGIILFGSGGETIPGDFMGISVIDFCHYIFGESEASDTCPPRETESFWPNLEKDETGLFTIVRGKTKGVMVPPVIVDVNGDSVSDILVSVYDGTMVLKNGKDLSDMWSVSFPNMESYGTPAPGYFDDDDVLDFMVHWNSGAWPWYTGSNVSVISGKDGSILWSLESSAYEMNSDLVLQTSDPHRDLFLFKLKGLGSPYRRGEEGKLIRENEHKRKKRHGEEERPPQSHEIPLGQPLDKNYMVKEYRKYHVTCDDDLTKHRGEMFIVDRSTMKNPLKILDIPLQKYWYDAPVVDPFHQYMHDESGKLRNISVPATHFGVGIPFELGGSKDHIMTDPRKNATKFERRCALLDSDDRSTGAIGDLDGDGVLEYIAIYARTGQLVDSRLSYYTMKYTLNVDVVSLHLISDKFKKIPVPSKSSFMLKQPLSNIRNVHILPYSDQKWTAYMGKHGNSKYRI